MGRSMTICGVSSNHDVLSINIYSQQKGHQSRGSHVEDCVGNSKRGNNSKVEDANSMSVKDGTTKMLDEPWILVDWMVCEWM